MVEFEKINDALMLRYESEQSGNLWVYRRLKEDGRITIKGTFHLTRGHLSDESAFRLSQFEEEGDLEDEYAGEPVEFRVAVLRGEYFVFDREILGLDVIC